MNLAIWSILEWDGSTRSHPKSDSLKADIQIEKRKLEEEVVRRSWASEKASFTRKIKEEGGHF